MERELEQKPEVPKYYKVMANAKFATPILTLFKSILGEGRFEAAYGTKEVTVWAWMKGLDHELVTMSLDRYLPGSYTIEEGI